jgi:COP9 signalosome complex subunit 5
MAFTSARNEKKKEDNQLSKSVKDRFYPFHIHMPFRFGLLTLVCVSTRIAVEAQHGLIAQVIKDVIFSMRPAHTGSVQVTDAVDNAMAIG